MRRLQLTGSARADLKSIARFTEQRWGKPQRNAYLRGMDRVFRMLVGNPFMGKACDEIMEGYRKLPHGAHVIYYRLPSAEELLIVRILHSSMDVDSRLER